MAGTLRRVSLGIRADGLADMLGISESLFWEGRRKLISAVCCRFEEKYLRRPLADNARNIMERNSKLGFSGALGLLDCSGWELHRGPVSEQRLTIGRSGSPEYHLES